MYVYMNNFSLYIYRLDTQNSLIIHNLHYRVTTRIELFSKFLIFLYISLTTKNKIIHPWHIIATNAELKNY